MRTSVEDNIINSLNKVNRIFHRLGVAESARNSLLAVLMIYEKNGSGITDDFGEIKAFFKEKAYYERVCDVLSEMSSADSEIIESLKQSVSEIYSHYINREAVDFWNISRNIFCKYNKNNHNHIHTPLHIADFMCSVTGLSDDKVVLDMTCGNGALLRAASGLCQGKNIHGIEADKNSVIEASLIMDLEGVPDCDVKEADCFVKEEHIISISPDVILLNPPYNSNPKDIPPEYRQDWAQGIITDPTKGFCYVNYLSDVIDKINIIRKEHGLKIKKIRLAVLLPVQCAMSTTKYIVNEKKKMLEKNTLEAVFSMPKDLFYPNNAPEICCMLFTMGVPHFNKKGQAENTFFGCFKEDGFLTRKNVGRIAVYNNGEREWDRIKSEWIRLYQNSGEAVGKSAVAAVGADDEWLCEAHLKTDYSQLTEDDFLRTVNDYLIWQIRSRQPDNEKEGGA